VPAGGRPARSGWRRVRWAGWAAAGTSHTPAPPSHPRPDGLVTAHFHDGSTETGDVLVGADGGNSRVRRQYLPHAARVDTGVTGIQGKVWLTDEIHTLVPARLAEGPVMIPGPRGYRMFLPIPHFQPIPPHLTPPY